VGKDVIGLLMSAGIDHGFPKISHSPILCGNDHCVISSVYHSPILNTFDDIGSHLVFNFGNKKGLLKLA